MINAKTFPDKVSILLTEFLCQDYNFVPEGIKIFLSDWKTKTGFKPDYFQISDKDELLAWIESLSDFSTIIIPVYKNPTPLINSIIRLIKNKNFNIQIFISGPLSQLFPEKCKNIINSDGILGSEPCLSLLEDNSLIFSGNEIPKKFFDIEKDSFPDVEDYWDIDGTTLSIFPESFGKCHSRCSFCQIGQNQDLQRSIKSFNFNQIINRIPDNIKFINNINVCYSNILDVLSFDEIKILIQNINNKIKFKTINLWTKSNQILKFGEKILDLCPYSMIRWNVGLESFNSDQLTRFNKGGEFYKKSNYELINLLNSLAGRVLISPLTIVFDPWSTRNEISETYNGISKIDKRILTCGQSGTLWNGLLSRLWNPFPNTSLYTKAKNENLLKLDKFGDFDYPFDQNYKYPESLTWNFKNDETKKIFEKLLDWDNMMEWAKDRLISKKMPKCKFCSGGYIFNRNNTSKNFLDMEKKLIEFIQGNDNLASSIEEEIFKMIESEL